MVDARDQEANQLARDLRVQLDGAVQDLRAAASATAPGAARSRVDKSLEV